MEEIGGLLLHYDLQMFAKDGPGGEKTEPATEKKLNDAREEGQVSKSRDLANGATLLLFFICIKIFISYIGGNLIDCFIMVYTKIADFGDKNNFDFNTNMAQYTIEAVIIRMMLILLPVFAIGVLAAFVLDIIQVKWRVTTKPLRPKFNKLNPVSGFKRIFSAQALVSLIKSIAILGALIMVVFSEFKNNINILFNLYDRSLQEAIAYIGNLIINIGIKISVVMLLIGIADFIYQKFKFKNDMKMTKQEVKDEFKNSEGDPQIKSQIKRRMMQASQRRMMQSVPKADVVITNPTHFAVAIQYEPMSAKAPIVLAKGEDYLAAKIKEVAKENQVTIVENKPLARMLYYNVDVGMEIPPELYQAVAEVLAFVYKLKNKQIYHAG